MSFRFGVESTRFLTAVADARPSPAIRRIADDAARELEALGVVSSGRECAHGMARAIVRPSGNSTLVVGSILADWSAHDALWDGTLAFVPQNKIVGSANLQDNLSFALTSAVFADPTLWGTRVALGANSALDTFFSTAARAFIRPKGDGRTIIAAQLPGAWVDRDEIWEGGIVAKPDSKRPAPTFYGFRADQAMTSDEFRR